MWTVLGLAPTDNTKKIKRAYARLLKQHHPEDDPVAFQKLHEAYRDALAYAEDGLEYEWDDEEDEVWEHEEDVPAAPEPAKSAPLIQALRAFTAKTDLGQWSDLFSRTSALSLEDRQHFEWALYDVLMTPVKGRKKTIVAADMPVGLFSLIDAHFHWRENERALLARQPWQEKHNAVFLKCLYQYATPTPQETIAQLSALLSTPYKCEDPKSWRDFFQAAQLMKHKHRYRLGREAFAQVVKHYGSALTPERLSALDRLFGWTRSGFGRRLVWLPRKFRKDAPLSLRLALINARSAPATYAPQAEYRKSVVRKTMTVLGYTIVSGYAIVPFAFIWALMGPGVAVGALIGAYLLYKMHK